MPADHNGAGSAEPGDDGPARQRRVNEVFGAAAPYWRDVYGGDDLESIVYGDRLGLGLRWARDLRPRPGARALDVGCGAGLLTAGLVDLGYAVDAVDASSPMLALVQGLVAGRRLTGMVTVSVGDVHALHWPDATFDLVTALGVLPWLHSPERAVMEMARVARPGGHVLLSADNSLRLSHLLDPRLNPALGPLRRRVGAGLRRAGLRRAGARPIGERRYTPRHVDGMIAGAGLRKLRGATVGFANFSFLGRPVLGEQRGQALHRRLQRLADRELPVVRSLGSHYVVLAAKAGGLPGCRSGGGSSP